MFPTSFIHSALFAVCQYKENYHYIEEKNVITGPETQRAKDLGESVRTDHLGKPFRVKSPIKSKKTKSKGTK